MLRLELGKKPDRYRLATFYCRMHNRMVGGCPRAQGPGGCPLLRECTADALHGCPSSATETTARH
jgi:hypothetical protein